ATTMNLVSFNPLIVRTPRSSGCKATVGTKGDLKPPLRQILRVLVLGAVTMLAAANSVRGQGPGETKTWKRGIAGIAGAKSISGLVGNRPGDTAVRSASATGCFAGSTDPLLYVIGVGEVKGYFRYTEVPGPPNSDFSYILASSPPGMLSYSLSPNGPFAV